MTSQERHEARYQRRKAKREEKRQELLNQYDHFENVTNRDVLSKAAHKAMRGVHYKPSVKQFETYELVSIGRLSNRLENRQNICQGFNCFKVMERGKQRNIMSIHFPERVVQKALNTNVLIPVLTHSLIYDNCAGQKGKGTSFAMERLTTQLRRFYRNHGNDGYVLKIDFKDYFGSIDHELAKQMIRDHFNDDGIIWLTELFIDSYYKHFANQAIKNGEDVSTVECKGLGLGSEVNQIIAIAFPNRIDHYAKEVLRIKCYERYMDDIILVHQDKEYLEYCLTQIRKICDELKITINERKTDIVKLSQGFTFLKTKFIVTDSGKIIKKPCHDAVVRTRRIMKKHRKMVENGVISYEEALVPYLSRRASLNSRTARRTIHNLDMLFMDLYKDYITDRRYEKWMTKKNVERLKQTSLAISSC